RDSKAALSSACRGRTVDASGTCDQADLVYPPSRGPSHRAGRPERRRSARRWGACREPWRADRGGHRPGDAHRPDLPVSNRRTPFVDERAPIGHLSTLRCAEGPVSPPLRAESTGELRRIEMASFSELLTQVKGTIREISIEETKARVADGANGPVLIDVRERDEYEQGFIPRAQWIPRGFLELKIEDAVPERDQEVILYCAGGVRSALAAKALQDMGYRKVSSMAGGFRAWKNAGFAFERPRVLTP